MKDKQFDSGRNNETAPARGMAAVNTHNPNETPIEKLSGGQKKKPDNDPKKQEPKNTK